MSGELYAVAGKKIYIGGVLANKAADFVAADFTSQTWTEIDGWETHGAYGDTKALITTSLINRGRDVKQGGTNNAGSMQNNFAIIRADAGQIALRAAQKTKSNYAFKIEDVDAPVSGTPTTALFIALVMSAAEQGGTANTVQMLNATLEINSNIVTVDAAE